MAKKNIPTQEEFLLYCRELLSDRYVNYEFSLKAKYDTWVEAGWKDGYKKPIVNWRLKIRNVIPFLKPMYNVPITKDYNRI